MTKELYSRHLEFYTDGAYSSKTEMGGWAAICLEDDAIIDTQSGFEPYSTGNRMELMAMLSVFENIATIESRFTKVTIYTDSAYVANTFNQGWYLSWMRNGWRTADKQEVKNQDLIKRLVALYIKYKDRFNIEIIKVAGHSGNKWNSYVDALAVKRRKELEA